MKSAAPRPGGRGAAPRALRRGVAFPAPRLVKGPRGGPCRRLQRPVHPAVKAPCSAAPQATPTSSASRPLEDVTAQLAGVLQAQDSRQTPGLEDGVWGQLSSIYLSSRETSWIYHTQAVAEDSETEEDVKEHWHTAPLIVHGSYAERGLAKADMQDRHINVQGIAEQAAQALQHPPLGEDEEDGEPGHTSPAPEALDLAASLLDLPSSLTAVFDGHGGSRSARYAAGHIRETLVGNRNLWAALGHAWKPLMEQDAVCAVSQALTQSFAQIDGAIVRQSEAKPPGEVDGTTALIGLQVGQHLFVANIGDSRAVMSRGGVAVRLTQDHTPEVPEERSRIEELGGVVRMHKGIWRLWLQTGNGYTVKISSVSRALGDIDFKRPVPLMASHPDVFHWVLHPRYDRFAIYASDGVWAVLSDQQAVDVAAAALAEARAQGMTSEQGAEVAARAVVEASKQMGTYDDVTACVNVFNWASE